MIGGVVKDLTKTASRFGEIYRILKILIGDFALILFLWVLLNWLILELFVSI